MPTNEEVYSQAERLKDEGKLEEALSRLGKLAKSSEHSNAKYTPSEQQNRIVFLTNLLEFGATTIAAIYKERWKIELFFKALKQNLTVKTFVGTSENALRIQIWTALIALLLLKWLHHLSKANWSLSNLASMLRLNLFTYRELTRWLDNPMGTPPLIPAAEQLTLALV